MPFVLCNVPSTFERLMEAILRGLTYESCLMYLDDVIVIGRTFQKHLLSLRKMFHPFREDRLNLNPEKSQHFQKEVQHLGHITSPGGITADPEKLKAVWKWPISKNKQEIRSFLGIYAYYRRVIDGFANIAKPLTKFTGESQASQWTPEVEVAFQTLKEIL
jgi:hypothetical protein